MLSRSCSCKIQERSSTHSDQEVVCNMMPMPPHEQTRPLHAERQREGDDEVKTCRATAAGHWRRMQRACIRWLAPCHCFMTSRIGTKLECRLRGKVGIKLEQCAPPQIGLNVMGSTEQACRLVYKACEHCKVLESKRMLSRTAAQLRLQRIGVKQTSAIDCVDSAT